jgi:hypothetical protein
MNPFLAKNQTEREYEAPTADELDFGQRRITVNFMAGEYKIERGAGMERETVESGLVAPEVTSDSRADRASRKAWINELIERVRRVAQDERLSFAASQGFSSIESADYR